MSFWAKAAGIGMAAAGIGLIATGVGAPAGAALISGGASVFAGDVAAEGAKKASQQQQTAADTAIKTQQQAAQAAQQAYSPYTALGQAAAGTLGSAMGLPVSPMGTGGTSLGALPAGMQVGLGTRPDSDVGLTGGHAVPRDDVAAATPQARAQLQTQSGYGGTLGSVGTGQLAKMRAPTGEVSTVAVDDVPHYEALGAQRVA